MGSAANGSTDSGGSVLIEEATGTPLHARAAGLFENGLRIFARITWVHTCGNKSVPASLIGDSTRPELLIQGTLMAFAETGVIV